MASRYYLAPWVQLFSLGGGRWSLTDPGGARSAMGSRVMIYGTWLRDTTGHFTQTVIPTGARGKAKDTCFSYVEAPDVDPLGLHAAIQADTTIALVPWQPDQLGLTFGTLTAQTQSAVRSYMASTFFDDQWIVNATLFGSIMSYVLHVLFGAQQLGSNYPDGPLTSRRNSLNSTQQTAINTFLQSKNILTISGNPTIREVVNRIALADYGGILFGATVFPAWTGS